MCFAGIRRQHWIPVLALILVSAQPLYALQPGQGPPGAVLNRIVELVRTEDSYAVAQYVEAQGNPSQVGELYDRLIMALYFTKKDLPGVTVTARAGIHYCLTKSAEEAGRDPMASEKFKGTAKTIAYNLASCTWSGWDEPGIRITPADLSMGLDAARLNLRLGRELKRGDAPMAAAHWMLGAHLLAAGDYAAAVREFDASAVRAREAKDTGSELLARGFAGMAKQIGELDAAGEREYTAVRDELAAGKIKDGKFFADQLDTARKVFMRPR